MSPSLDQVDLLLSYIAEDPTILSGTLRSTLDVFEEYEDAEIVSNDIRSQQTPNQAPSV